MVEGTLLIILVLLQDLICLPHYLSIPVDTHQSLHLNVLSPHLRQNLAKFG